MATLSLTSVVSFRKGTNPRPLSNSPGTLRVGPGNSPEPNPPPRSRLIRVRPRPLGGGKPWSHAPKNSIPHAPPNPPLAPPIRCPAHAPLKSGGGCQPKCQIESNHPRPSAKICFPNEITISGLHLFCPASVSARTPRSAKTTRALLAIMCGLFRASRDGENCAKFAEKCTAGLHGFQISVLWGLYFALKKRSSGGIMSPASSQSSQRAFSNVSCLYSTSPTSISLGSSLPLPPILPSANL